MFSSEAMAVLFFTSDKGFLLKHQLFSISPQVTAVFYFSLYRSSFSFLLRQWLFFIYSLYICWFLFLTRQRLFSISTDKSSFFFFLDNSCFFTSPQTVALFSFILFISPENGSFSSPQTSFFFIPHQKTVVFLNLPRPRRFFYFSYRRRRCFFFYFSLDKVEFFYFSSDDCILLHLRHRSFSYSSPQPTDIFYFYANNGCFYFHPGNEWFLFPSRQRVIFIYHQKTSVFNFSTYNGGFLYFT